MFDRIPFTVGARLAALAASLLLAACASTPRVDAEWTDNELGTQSALLRGARVLVACQAPDVAIRNVCQDGLTKELRARGSIPVFVPDSARFVASEPFDAQLVSIARAASAKAIFVVELRPVSSEKAGGFSFGIGGFGFGSSSAVGGGISAPVGEQRVDTGFGANGRVTDVTRARLVWSTSVAAAPSQDTRGQFASLSKSVADSAERAGLF